MNTLTHTRSVIAGLSALSLLALTACGNDDDAAVDTAASDETADQSTDESSNEGNQTDAASAETVYAFAPESDLSAQELHIELPEELVEKAEGYAENRVFDHMVVRAGEHPDSSCSIEVEYHYADEDRDLIENVMWATNYPADTGEEPTWHESTIDERYEALLSLGDDTEINEDQTSTITPMDCAASPSDDSEIVTLGFHQVSEQSTPEGADEPTNGTPYALDYPIATVDLNVMTSGDINIVTSEVRDHHYSGDEHGWLSDSETVDSQGNVIDN